MNPKVDSFFSNADKWHAAFKHLRAVCLDCGLTETIKWKHPCYMYKEDNIVLIHGFKEYCALLFFKGSLLNDTDNILVQQTKNVQAARQIRFTNAEEVQKMKSIIKSYIFEAIEVEKAGLKVDLKKTSEYEIPKEFQQALDEDPSLKKAFKALTPGRQRGYLLYFSSAKQSKTRYSRIEKYTPKIHEGKGLNDH
ncbi:YdeI family protein [Galbibacter sp. PAP.153]|uniref:YdeI/OmpD-associated family protein n=1 Tax=Galbibacter sp. PAP.153 TaxID=3104623 RepID=UPI00300B1AFD